MKEWLRQNWPFLVILTAMSAYALWDVLAVPFHPDESTQLFMSSDVEAFLTQPLSLAWDTENSSDPKQIYHTLDAPITRYFLGIGRLLNDEPPLPADWDWSKDWQDNKDIGALPSPSLLRTGRLTISLLLPISLFLLYQIGKMLSGTITALLAAVLMGTNALILLHARRAMAEGTLILGLLIAIWSFLVSNKRPWLAGIGMAMAFCAKQSTLPLLPIGWLAVCWDLEKTLPLKGTLRRCLVASSQYFGVFLVVTIALNPFLWRDPINAALAALRNRQELLSSQISDTARLAPELVLTSPLQRTMVLLANVYIEPPSFWEVGNYKEATAHSEKMYLETPGHNLFRNAVGGIVFLTLSLIGLAAAGFQLRQTTPNKARGITILLSVTALQAGALIATIPLPWQRYVIPLVPLTCLWCAYALGNPLDKGIAGKASTL